MSWLRIKGITVLAQVLLAVLFTVSVQGCVTTKSGGFASKADEQKAFDTSLQLARNYFSGPLASGYPPSAVCRRKRQK